jgi:hypothetical protein
MALNRADGLSVPLPVLPGTTIGVVALNLLFR